MKTLAKMNKDERSLLLFFESNCTEYGGYFNIAHMNQTDIDIAEKWAKEGFVKFGRLAFEFVTPKRNYWATLSDEAWKLAHQERKARFGRLYASRNWCTTEEKQMAEGN